MTKATKENTLKVGDRAPDFTVSSTQGTMRLSQQLKNGPVVLALYPKDFTPGWTIEMTAFQSDLADFEKLDAQVLGVSKDSLETHQKFAASLGLNFPLLVDDGSISAQYGNGRITYLIDRTGVIRLISEGMPDNATLAREIGKL